MLQSLRQGEDRTPRLGRLDYRHDLFGQDYDAVAENDDSQETHAAHEMGLCEAQDVVVQPEAKGEQGLGGGDNVPCDEDLAVVVLEVERDAEIDEGRDRVHGDLGVECRSDLFELANVP